MSLTVPAAPEPAPEQETLSPTAGDEPVRPHRGRLAGLRDMLPRRTPKLVAGLVITGGMVLYAIIGPMLVGSPSAVDNIGMSPPSAGYWLGTTQTGQDIAAQLAWGARGSLTVGVSVGLISLVLAGFFGIVGAYRGGVTDNVFSLLTNVMLVIPGLPLMIVIASYVNARGIGVIILVLALTSWAGGARILRGQVLSLRSRDYVLAARVAGERTWRVLVVEILPNLLPVLAGAFVFGVIFAVLGEAGLSFIGLGASGTFTWGTMFYYAQNGFALRLGAWWWFLPPGIMIALLGAGLALVNSAIDEVINPRLRTPKGASRQARRDPEADAATSKAVA